MRLSDNVFLGITTLNEIEAAGRRRPTDVEHASAKERDANTGLEAAYDLRKTIQRRFDKARGRRAEAYANYLWDLIKGNSLGGFPPVTLYSLRPGTGGLLPGDALRLPLRNAIVAIDGETQTEARFILRDRDEDVIRFRW